jgi:outer membrane protein OmpA-like peptidoglycan-associated protein
MLKTNFKYAASILVVLTLSGCVATRKHVKSVSDPLDRRVGSVEAKNREVDTKLSAHETAIALADERAKGADAKASDAAKEAKGAHERIGQVGEQVTAAAGAAGTANKNATEARTVADQGLSKASELEQRMAALDKFQLLQAQSVLFGTAMSKLTPEGQKLLDETAAQAGKLGRYVIEVQGFTDRTGNPDANLALSRQRADEVVRYLTIQHKIPLYRIYQLGSGALVPVADNNTRTGRQQNRRVEVKLYTTSDAEGKKVTASSTGGR